MQIIDDMRHFFGIRTQQDRDAVARGLEALERDMTPAGRLARDVAYAAVPTEAGRRPLPDGLVRMMLPEIPNDARPLPRDPDVRRLQIAEAAARTIEKHLAQGYEQWLGPELGRAVRQESVTRSLGAGMTAQPLDKVLENRSERLGLSVAAYLAHGAKVEAHHKDMVREIPARGMVSKTVDRLRGIGEMHPDRAPESGPALGAWVDRGLRTERAMARAGLLAPKRIIAAADATMGATAEGRVAALAAEPRARPDFQATQTMQPAARRDLVRSWMTSAERPTPTAANRTQSNDTPVREAGIKQAVLAGIVNEGRSM